MRYPIVIDAHGCVRRRRHDWWFAAVQKAKQEIMNQEDERIFKALDEAMFEIVYSSEDGDKDE